MANHSVNPSTPGVIGGGQAPGDRGDFGLFRQKIREQISGEHSIHSGFDRVVAGAARDRVIRGHGGSRECPAFSGIDQGHDFRRPSGRENQSPNVLFDQPANIPRLIRFQSRDQPGNQLRADVPAPLDLFLNPVPQWPLVNLDVWHVPRECIRRSGSVLCLQRGRAQSGSVHNPVASRFSARASALPRRLHPEFYSPVRRRANRDAVRTSARPSSTGPGFPRGRL